MNDIKRYIVRGRGWGGKVVFVPYFFWTCLDRMDRYKGEVQHNSYRVAKTIDILEKKETKSSPPPL